MEAQLNLFTSYDAFRMAQAEVIRLIRKQFSNLPIEEIEEFVSESFLIAHRFQQTGRLAIPLIAFVKVIARRKATDVTRQQASLRRQGIVFVDTDFVRAIPVYTEGGIEKEYDDDSQFLIEAATRLINKQSIEMQQVFEAANDSVLSELTDIQLAQHFNFKTQTSASVRKKRFDLNTKLKHHLSVTPQYKRLKGSLSAQRQVAA